MHYSVKDYIEMLAGHDQLLSADSCSEILDSKISYMSYNSRDIKPGTMFICKGAGFKESYLLDAAVSGALVYVSEKNTAPAFPV
ncbi:hypothetical protein K7I13_00415 [Brucepastera parasyntrophica]|uniref:hypothetical protein n=1 Tax=Brucepastera parasyntrophica TaxID=2880008 RepID=UPI00210C7436|nr:hypothetical protein [Brucepastera parasyntrophica]ULQ59856.1 hypothetical protein K7I13_00415 [Brucepastera parasyntrophica]